MASLRHMRRSRRSSSIGTSVQDNLSVNTETQGDENDADASEEWTEPPLRTPAPSFEDYKGLERHGVLEHMAPLGSLPGSKVKSRLKQHDHTRRTAHLKNGDARGARDEVSTPEPAAPLASKGGPEPRKPEERLAKLSSSRERDGDYEYTPKANTRVTPAKTISTQAAANGTLKAIPRQGGSKLKQIVDTAIQRASDLGDDVLGIAVKQLYEESLQNQVLANLLNAVLTQRPTPQQTTEFQNYIKGARKKIKSNDETTAKSLSKSPAAKGPRASVARHFGTPKDPTTAAGLNHHPPSSNHCSSRQNNANMAINGSPSKDERPSKRLKRSKSASSDSTLSSLDSAVEDFAPTIEASLPSVSDLASTQRITQSKFKTSMGPRLGSFSTRPSDPAMRRPIISTTSTATSPTPEDLLARKQERERLKQSFQDHVVQDSGIRSGPTPMQEVQSTAPITILTERRQQARLRNGASHRNRRHYYDSLDSPESSSFGESLIPPPAGASRGTTPNNLGRPPKAIKKAARIKMSKCKITEEETDELERPMKKRGQVTAGIARATEAENSAVGNGRSDDNQDSTNSDVCTACSGNGRLLCCDGCWRSYHFTCFDPPMSSTEAENVEGKWYCYQCRATRSAPALVDRGVFGELEGDLGKKNPIAFNLPRTIRDFFEGVKTGDEGEYEEAIFAKPNKTRGGYEELPDNFKLKDNKDNSVLCFRCGESSMPNENEPSRLQMLKRELVPCSYCNLSWHLDCLDPPLAISPLKRSNGRTKGTWMCPNHVDHELANLGAKAQALNKVHPDTGRAFKIRRPKNATIVDIGLRRGFKNNGLIEIQNDPSDDEDDYEKDKSGVVYRVTEQGLKLDFIDRVKRLNQEEAQMSQGRVSVQSRDASTRPRIRKHTKKDHMFNNQLNFAERKTALNLVQLAQPEVATAQPEAGSSAGNGQDDSLNLLNALIAEAPAEVEKLCAAEEAVQEKKALEKLIYLARRRIEKLEKMDGSA